MRAFGILALITAAMGGLAATADVPAGPPKAVFELREVSALQESGEWYRLLRGQQAACSRQPSDQVKTYPVLHSARPLYGSVTFGRTFDDPKAGRTFYFVLDESQPVPSGKVSSATAPESVTHYDRLYLDRNQDLDLTNDAPLLLMKDPPQQAKPDWKAQQVAFFEYLDAPLDYGASLGTRPFRVLPRLTVIDHDSAILHFVSLVARKGEIQIGRLRYMALLAQPHAISGRFDLPFTYIELRPVGNNKEERDDGWGMDELRALREVGGQAYTLSASPLGDQLTVAPYQGEWGFMEVGAGKRKIADDQLGITGSIKSTTLVAPLPGDRAHPPRRHRVPVGDYSFPYVMVQYGRLAIRISENYHSDGKPRDRGGRPTTYAMRVRGDKPFVLDFSNQPEVLFTSPGKDQNFRRGEEIKLSAVLIDPVLDIMIRDLDDTTRKEKEKTNLGNGQTTEFERTLSLAPTVTIANAGGKILYSGKMPFG